MDNVDRLDMDWIGLTQMDKDWIDPLSYPYPIRSEPYQAHPLYRVDEDESERNLLHLQDLLRSRNEPPEALKSVNQEGLVW